MHAALDDRVLDAKEFGDAGLHGYSGSKQVRRQDYLGGSGVVVLTDLYGATPSRIAARLAEPHRVLVLAGVNLPMLVKALNNRRVPLDALVQTLVTSAKAAILEVAPHAEEGGPSAPG